MFLVILILKINVKKHSYHSHVDHGKTTLIDSMMKQTESLENQNITERLMDSGDLEKERGITILVKLPPSNGKV